MTAWTRAASQREHGVTGGPLVVAIAGLGLAMASFVVAGLAVTTAAAWGFAGGARAGIGLVAVAGGLLLSGRLVGLLEARRVGAALGLSAALAVAGFAVVSRMLGVAIEEWIEPSTAGLGGFAGATYAAGALAARRRPGIRRTAVAALGMAVLWSPMPGAAWISGPHSPPAAGATATGSLDVAAGTHQWATAQAVEILQADGRTHITDFLGQGDPTAPEAHDPATGAVSGGPRTYGRRLLLGSRDADGPLYPKIRDHLHNFWTHHGRRWIVGASAASNAEFAFSEATRAWKQGDRAQAMYWLGASVHLVQDACVPQHNFFGLGFYHHDFEVWVLENQSGLGVTSGGIYRSDFRVKGGHGGEEWSSGHPRGWADECAHRAVRHLRAASHHHARGSPSGPSDPQWRAAPLVGDMQRLAAGYIAFFFEEVGGP